MQGLQYKACLILPDVSSCAECCSQGSLHYDDMHCTASRKLVKQHPHANAIVNDQQFALGPDMADEGTGGRTMRPEG